MLMLSRFQLVDTVVMSFDIILGSVSTVISFIGDSYNLQDFDVCSFEYSISYLRSGNVGTSLMFFSLCFLASAHAELFFIYLLFFKKFRRAFFNGAKSVFKKMEERFCKKENKIFVASINVSNLMPENNMQQQ